MKRLLIISAVFLLTISLQSKAQAVDETEPSSQAGDSFFSIDKGRLVNGFDGETSFVDTPGPVVSLHKEDGLLYAAMGEHGVAVYNTSDPKKPILTKHIPISHGRVTGFIPIEGRLWMQIESRTAVLVEGGFPASGNTQAGVTMIGGPLPEAGAAQDTSKYGEKDKKNTLSKTAFKSVNILEIHPGKVKLNVGREQSVRVGDRFSAYRDSEVSLGKDEVFEGKELVAVLKIIAVGDNTSVALLWKGDRVTKNDVITPVENGQKSSWIYPRRLSNIGEISVTIRPVLAVGSTGGFGALCDIAAAYWHRKIFFGFRMQPLGFGWAEDGNVVTTSLLADVGFDSRPFAVGLGAGVAFVNGDIGSMLNHYGGMMSAESKTEDNEEPKWNQETHHAFALSQHVRMGARNGLNLTVYNTLLYFKGDDETDAGFIYGGTTGKFTWPIAKRSDMFIEGGGGVMGYAFGAVGVFSWLKGNGDAGSVGMSVSAGGAGVWGQRTRIVTSNYDGELYEHEEQERISIGGPMISLGLLYRFGS